MASFSSSVSLGLIPLLISSPVWSQTGAPAGDPVRPATPSQLTLRLTDSDGSQVLSNTRTVRGLGVQVNDGNGAPVQGAAVVFRFPDSGSSASFSDGSHSAVAYTDDGGNAHIANFQWNPMPGVVPIRITATKGTTHAGLLVEETLTAGTPSQASVPARPVTVPATESGAVLSNNEPEEVVLPAASAKVAESASAAGGDYLSNPYRGARLGVSPMVSISNAGKSSGADYSYHPSRKKWIILGIVAGVGAGAVFALMNAKGGSSGAAAASTSGVSVGAPTISIGHP